MIENIVGFFLYYNMYNGKCITKIVTFILRKALLSTRGILLMNLYIFFFRNTLSLSAIFSN